MITHVAYAGKALPDNADVVSLFDSTVSCPGGLNQYATHRVVVDLQNSQSGTLKAYQSPDSGVNWYQVVPDQAVAASAANDVNINDWCVEQYKDWKVTWTNGATIQTVFRVNVCMVDQRNVAT